jgi:hypothetical protein
LTAVGFSRLGRAWPGPTHLAHFNGHVRDLVFCEAGPCPTPQKGKIWIALNGAGPCPVELTELFELVGDNRNEMETAWRLVRSGAIVLAAIEHSELPEIQTLMSRYSHRPMDFADATLVYLAKREALSTIFTVDHAGFDTYRTEGRRRFRVLPAKRP